jgi:hypothetical protein
MYQKNGQLKAEDLRLALHLNKNPTEWKSSDRGRQRDEELADLTATVWRHLKEKGVNIGRYSGGREYYVILDRKTITCSEGLLKHASWFG